MSGLIYLNGMLVPEREANLPIRDRSYLYGEGLFETMKAHRGMIPFLPEHLSRLYTGMEMLHLSFNTSASKLEFAIEQTLLHNQLKDAYVRVSISRENEEWGSLQALDKTNLVVVVNPLQTLPVRIYQEGSSACLLNDFQILPDALCQIKSTNYLKYLLAQQEARRRGAEEGFLLNTHGRLVEGATSNIFIFDGESWITPPQEEGALLGVTRHVLLDIMKKNKISCAERPITVPELRDAKEIIATNAIREIVPVTQLDGDRVNGGGVGKNTLLLRQLFQEEIQYRLESLESKQWGIE